MGCPDTEPGMITLRFLSADPGTGITIPEMLTKTPAIRNDGLSFDIGDGQTNIYEEK
jgi:hypothetical protein